VVSQVAARPPRTQNTPIISTRWRWVTFIVTTGDRFMQALEINDLFEQESPAGQLYVRLKELGIAVEREWWIDEEGITYAVDLALPVEEGWLTLTFGDRPGQFGWNDLLGGGFFASFINYRFCLFQAVLASRLPASLASSSDCDHR
jgi:hypothetical protein